MYKFECPYIYMCCIHVYMFMYLHVYLYIFTYICIHVYMCICLYIYIHICIYLYTPIIYMHVYAYTCIYIYVYVFVYNERSALLCFSSFTPTKNTRCAVHKLQVCIHTNQSVFEIYIRTIMVVFRLRVYIPWVHIALYRHHRIF